MTMNPDTRRQRRTVLRVMTVAGTALLTTAMPAWAQVPGGWPQKPIKLVVPFPAGGNVDAYARVLAPALAKELGQPVVIENKAGATGAIGVASVMRADPDGYTVLMGNITSIVGTAVLDKDAKLEPLKRLMPVCTTIEGDAVILVNGKLGIKNLGDLKAYKSSKPLMFGSSGSGSIAHLAMLQMLDNQGIKAIHIPYKGNGQFVVDLLAGHIELGLADLTNTAQHIKAGALVPVAVTGKQRMVELPNVPSTGELGIERPNFSAWIGLLLPAGTPDAIASTLAAASERAVKAPALVAFASSNGNRNVFRNAQQTRQVIADGLADYGAFVNSKLVTESMEMGGGTTGK